MLTFYNKKKRREKTIKFLTYLPSFPKTFSTSFELYHVLRVQVFSLRQPYRLYVRLVFVGMISNCLNSENKKKTNFAN